MKKAMAICDKYDLKTSRGFALAFDIVNQNGSISSEASSIIDDAILKNLSIHEKELLEVIANAVSSNAGNINLDVLSRKMAIVKGKGIVHGSLIDVDVEFAFK